MEILGCFDSARICAVARHASRAIGLATLVLGVVLGALPVSFNLAAWADEPAPQPSAGSPPRLPMLSTQGPPTKVEGKIARSSRGRKGPVRLLVERAGGDPVTILVAADEYCERVGLSLRTGETITVEGTMVKGERPILLASSITADGKTVRVRDAAGKLVDAGGASAATSGATLGGGKPPADGAKPVTGATKP